MAIELNRVGRLRFGETARQATMLFSANTVSSGIGFLSGIVLAHAIEPAEMGRLTFCITFIVVAGLFVEMGAFSAGARLLALSKSPEEERERLGAMLIVAAVLCTGFVLFIALTAGAVDWFFGTNVKLILLAAALLTFFQPFQWLVEYTCQGLNQISRLAAFQLLLSALNLGGLVLLSSLGRLNAGSALIAYLAALALPGVWTVARLKPLLRESRSRVRELLSEARRFGFNLYLSRITGTVSTRIDSLVIAYFITDMAPLGFYGFAQKLAGPMLTASRALGTSRYRSFAGLRTIPRQLLWWNLMLLLAAGTTLVVAGPFVLRAMLPRYADSASLLLPFGLMNLFNGLFQPYNAFLSARGQSASIRNIAITVTVAMIAGLLLTVPQFGVKGAAWTSAAAMALDYGLYVFYYSKFVNGADSTPAGEPELP